MHIISSKNTIEIIRRTLNMIDVRLIDHGERVSFIIYKMLQYNGKHTEREIIDICILAMFHDVGAYKTEEIDDLFAFESNNVWGHSIYGYLFLKELSPLSNFADSILFHHTDYNKLENIDCKNRDLAELINLADRIDVMLSRGLEVSPKIFNKYKDKKFSGNFIDLFFAAQTKYDIMGALKSGIYIDEFLNGIESVELSETEIEQYLRMIIYTIDFRSEATVTHTVTTINISVEIAKTLNLSPNDIKYIYYGSMLHDIGKIAIPISILEKPGGLTNDEIPIMQKHVVYTGDILDNYLDETVYKIAVRHHEKLDGTGYPDKLTGDMLSLNERIVAVGDILSALVGKRSYKDGFDKIQVVDILEKMADSNKICSVVTRAVIENYDNIIHTSSINSKDVISKYASVKKQYALLYQQYAVDKKIEEKRGF